LKYFSKKKVVLVILLAFILIGGGFVLLNPKTGIGTLTFERNTGDDAGKALRIIVAKDTDGDGLKDWEEALWKTNPNNPDSDEDGTTDGEEVRADRDPTKPAPRDEREKQRIEQGAETSAGHGALTDVLIERALVAYTLSGQDGNQEILKRLDASLMEEIEKNVVLALPTYRIEDFIIVGNSSEEVEEYKNKLMKIGLKYSAKHSKKELVIVDDALKSGNRDDIPLLDNLSYDYQNMAQEFSKMKVPEAIAQQHLALTNAYDATANAVENMGLVLTDPITTLIGILQYKQYAYSASTAIYEIKKYTDNYSKI